MSYSKTTWVQNSQPAITADRLNNIESGVEEAHVALDSFSLVGGEYPLSNNPVFSSIFLPIAGVSFTGEGSVIFNHQQTILPMWFA